MKKIIFRCLVGLMLTGTTLVAQAQSIVDGEAGLLHVSGSLTASPCRLDMVSQWQSVTLGNISTGQLQQAGAQGQPVNIELQLQDCLQAASYSHDANSGNLLWSPHQPAVTVRFRAPADKTMPELFAVAGASGLGLRLRDAHGHNVLPNSDATQLLLNDGQNILSYTLTPERTGAPLRAGNWHTLISFGLEYD
ncbi:TPA: type 1 fimbrial protein [Enterobacter roggenkampii]|nr:type 1 fimbrial protein [Enterobacter roggenkampii]